MKIKHHGYSLIEVLIITAVIVVLIALSVSPMREVMTEVPRSNRIYQTWSASMGALEVLKHDVEQSRQILSIQDDTLTLEHADGVITYSFSEGQISRHEQDADSKIWSLPYMRFEPELWGDNGKPYALQITTYHQQTVLGREQIRLKQSYVFFQKGVHQLK